jgi:hypothetical protein
LIARRAFIAGLGARWLCAQDRAAYVDVLGGMAAALAASEPTEFLRFVDASAPERDRLRTLVEALLAQAEVTSSIEVIDIQAGLARVDWYMEVRGRAPGARVERRRQELAVRLNAHRRVTELRPVEFFAPPSPQA